jgi:hypothetical protein
VFWRKKHARHYESYLLLQHDSKPEITGVVAAYNTPVGEKGQHVRKQPLTAAREDWFRVC